MTHKGILFIGDPHVASRVPGFRCDDYPDVVLDKLAWCMDYAQQEELRTAILGDLFHFPRDNANRLLARLIDILSGQCPLAIYGNHDVHENQLTMDDSLSVVAASGAIQLLEPGSPWQGEIGGRKVVIGGTSWGLKMPTEYVQQDSLVFWMTHHDLKVPGYEEHGRIRPQPLAGIDAVINGHIHRRLETVQAESTSWFTPGNIARVSRGDATRDHVPSVLRVDIDSAGWMPAWVEVPHLHFEKVFHAAVLEDEEDVGESTFVRGLAELKARRTESGAGLRQLLDDNLPKYEQDVQDEINQLADEVFEK
jgi:DNA repair exonuclease SbcCD nuclease subunit